MAHKHDQVLSGVLEAAYAEGPDSPDSLLLVHDRDTIPSAESKRLKPSAPPVAMTPTSDFHGATVVALVAYLQEAADRGPVSDSYFLIVDEQTMEDQTMLLVKCPKKTMERDEVKVESVRLAASQANAPVVAMQIGCGSIMELKSNVGDDGVYRGSKGPPPKQGSKAPRKKLGA